MSKWQDKSDAEINAAVKSVLVSKHEKESDFDRFFLDILKSSNLDYCNDAAFAWSIILDNKIDIEFAVEHLGCIGQAHVYIEGDTDIFCEFTDNNKALRAAMIVYLEINNA